MPGIEFGAPEWEMWGAAPKQEGAVGGANGCTLCGQGGKLTFMGGAASCPETPQRAWGAGIGVSDALGSHLF